MTSIALRSASACLLTLLALPLAEAQEPYLVEDIYPGGTTAVSSNPHLFTAGDLVFMFATDPEHGQEPWITDGTPEGTRLLRDLCPGPCWSRPEMQWTFPGRLFFTASRESGQQPPVNEMYVSNGTWEGTRFLSDGVRLGNAAVGALEDRGLFFFEGGYPETIELWVTDGTPAGTRAVQTGTLDDPVLGLRGSITAGRGALIYAARTATAGWDPWISDGTPEGTRRLHDPVPGFPFGTFLSHLRRLTHGTTYFVTSSNRPCDTTLWFTDGTAPGTVPLQTFDSPECTRVIGDNVRQTDDAIYFFAGAGGEPFQLWRSDGTLGGTRALTSFPTESLHTALIPTADATFFAAEDPAHGHEPWIADDAGTRRLADVCPGTCSSTPFAVGHFGDDFYFMADDGIHGTELWRSDGTEAGTRLVEDVCPGACGSWAYGFGEIGDRVLFLSQPQELQGPGAELWATTAGAAGATRLTDFAIPNPVPGVSPSGPQAVVSDLYLFPADDGERGMELWRSDGTPEGTRLAVEIAPGRLGGQGSGPVLITPWDDRVLFFAREPDVGYQPWISDGTEAGTRRLGIAAEPFHAAFESPYEEPLVLGSRALFLVRGVDGDTLELWRTTTGGPPERLVAIPGLGSRFDSAELVRLGERALLFAGATQQAAGGIWVSDGTVAGTSRLAEMGIFSVSGESLGGRIFFGGADDPGLDDWELWATDGTVGGTARVADIYPGPQGSEPRELTRLGDRLLFSAGTLSGYELWESDGTAEGTHLVVDILPGFDDSHPRLLTASGDRVYFVADDLQQRPHLWVTDGTAAGTLQLAAFAAGELPESYPRVAAASRFFMIRDFDRNELLVSDGTPAGTGSLAPLFPPGALAQGLWSAGERVRVSLLVFDGYGYRTGIWETDGTFSGTRNLTPGGVGPVDHLAQAGSLLFFNGFHPEAGQELMALPLGPPAPCAADAETLCLRNGRFAVRTKWRDPRSGDSGTAGALPMPGSDRTGLFWFFAPDNVELVVKTLDGGGVNGFFWNFYGALSDVEYEIEVVDTATGRRAEYFNPGGEICGLGDTTAFPARPPVPLPVPPEAVAAPVRSTAAPEKDGTACGGSADDLCLLGGRFRVEVEWTDQRSGDSGAGTAVPYADRSGFFWFFEPQNVELVVKILDGRNVNGRFWVFYGALSDVEYTIRVTDTETGAEATYHNPPGEICGRGDTAAF